MTESAPFAFSADGAVLVCGDGPELLVYQGHDGAPTWKAFCDGLLVGVAVIGQQVITLDTDGRLQWYRAADGLSQEQTELGAGTTALLTAPDGAVGAVTSAGLHILRAGQLSVVSMGGVTAAAFGPDGNSLGVGTSSGAFSAIDPTSGAAWGTVELGSAVGGVCWSAAGQWIVTAGDQLVIVSGDGTQVLKTIGGGAALGTVCSSDNGILVAALGGDRQVVVFELHGGRQIGTIDFRRELHGMAFGTGALLGIGLDDGDASRIDLFSGTAVRTEPHQGRGRNTWNHKFNVDKAAVRGAIALDRAGGTPIARYVGPEDDDEGGGWLRTCLTLLLVSTVLCTGCFSCSGLLYLLRGWGYI